MRGNTITKKSHRPQRFVSHFSRGGKRDSHLQKRKREGEARHSLLFTHKKDLQEPPLHPKGRVTNFFFNRRMGEGKEGAADKGLPGGEERYEENLYSRGEGTRAKSSFRRRKDIIPTILNRKKGHGRGDGFRP